MTAKEETDMKRTARVAWADHPRTGEKMAKRRPLTGVDSPTADVQQ